MNQLNLPFRISSLTKHQYVLVWAFHSVVISKVFFLQVKTDAQIRDKVEHLGAKVATLSASLSTITAEKSRIETNFQRDRKKLLHEKEEVRWDLERL